MGSLFRIFGDDRPTYAQPKGLAVQIAVPREKGFLEQIFCWMGCYDPVYRPAPAELQAEKGKGK